MMKKVSKLAVFDLDDTLYDGNSHFMLLNAHYKTTFFTSIFMRILGRVLPSIRMLICNYCYYRIAEGVRKNFALPYRSDVMEVLRKKQQEGWTAVIVSNAPDDLLQGAAARLHLQALRAGFHQKAEVVRDCFEYENIFVCTDNKTDIDLLELADEAVITCRSKDNEYFTKRLGNKKIEFMNRG